MEPEIVRYTFHPICTIDHTFLYLPFRSAFFSLEEELCNPSSIALKNCIA